MNDSLAYGFNRAKIAWYNIEPTLQDNTNSNNPVKVISKFWRSAHVHLISITNLFPQETPQYGQGQLITFDIAYYPKDKGPYNFEVQPTTYSKGLATNGQLNNPETRWGGIMRAIDQTDFETNNIQYIEFWMQSPYLYNTTPSPNGQLYIDLGSVSEDILKDGKRQYENGLPTPNIAAATDTSVWGKVPLNPTQVTNAFSNDPSDRPYQDVGFDGLTDSSERVQFAAYLQQLSTSFPGVYPIALNDPSGDNFLNYRDASYDNAQANILSRYKNINSPQGNSPVATTGQQYVSAFTQYPDEEDLDHDNTLNTLEQFFEYKVNLSPNALAAGVGQNFIADSTSFTPGGSSIQQTWYQFRIPINSFYKNVGNIPDFKSIRFIRMFLTGFDDSVVFRFAEFQLIRDSWRSFSYVLDTTGNYTPLPTNGPTTFNVTAVNVEQNSSRTPIPYVIPPGIQRQQQLSTNNVNVLLNEQSLSIQVCNLAPDDARGVYKTVNLDLRKYGKLDMFVHAEATGSATGLNDKDLYGVIRIGSDFISNFYEIKIPLVHTAWGTTDTSLIWPDSNNLNLTLSRFVSLKEDRNNKVASNVYYSETDPNGRVYSIIGNPNLGAVQAIFLGVRNASQSPKCAEIWFDELRLSNINDQGGWAALGRVDVKLADLGTAYVSGSYKSVGFGSIDQHINDRSLADVTQLDAATTLELGKLLPKKLGISIPTYTSISKSLIMPEYDPFDLDIKLKDKLKMAPASERDSIREQAIDATTIQTINFTNVRKLNLSGKKPKLWGIENFDLSYSYTRSEHHNDLATEDELINYKGGLGYNYSLAPKPWQPFKKRIKSKSLWYGLVRDFNINFLPTVLSFREDANRQFGAYRSRNIGGPADSIPETFNKFFNIKRIYVLRWDITKSLNFDFAATNNSVVDEDAGRLDKSGKRRMWSNFLKGGRNVLYQQTANITYTLPTGKIPLLDWTTTRIGYSATYNWTAASLLAVSLGNTLQNTQVKNINSELDFTKLYSKWKWLRAIDIQPSGNSKNNPNKNALPNKNDTARNKTPQLKNPNDLPHVNSMLRFVARMIISVKRISLNYSENSASTIYGYLDSTQALGMDLRNGQPGLGYVFGKQPDANFVQKLAQKGLLTTDTTFNFQNQQSFNQKFNITAVLQPFRDFNIDLNLDKTFGKTYTELFKDTTSTSGFSHLNPYNAGTFSISFISLKTMFQTTKADELSSAFKTFENDRAIVSARLGQLNPYSGKLGVNGYYTGYGQYAQDVLIPAFIAAYTGKDPNKISLVNENNTSVRTNPFSGYLPKPNWRISYNGLARLPGFDKIFTSFNLTHAYTSTLSMSSFSTQLLYQDPLGIRYPGFIDTVSGNFVPYFTVPNITITESFSPLLNIDMQFVNQLQARVGYNKSRQLSLSMIDYQLTESRSSEFTFGGGWKKKGMPLPFKIKMPGKAFASKKLDNELNFRLDFSIRNDITSNSILDQGNALPTGGQKTVTITPSISYVMSNRITAKLEFDQRRVTPKISTSPPIITTRANIQIRISLAP